MNEKLMDIINNPSDLKKLRLYQLVQLSEEIRQILIATVSKTGGHLSSNLGVVELTIALHWSFNSPKDLIYFDVGHQCYTHKLLTGRKNKFHTLRQLNGLSGFPKSYESPHDAFVSGHSSNSLSAAYATAISNKMNGLDNYVIVVIGDGALTGGQAYEALNNIGRSDVKIIIIINNNGMSISKNVGSFSRYLSSIRSKNGYMSLKKGVSRKIVKIPLVGNSLYNSVEWSKKMLKTILYNQTFFEDMGFTYFGQVDGHNIKRLIISIKQAKNLNRPVVIQVKTIKGKGYFPAEQNPGGFHGVGSFDIDVDNPDVISDDSYSAKMGKHLTKLADKNNKIYAITAAMKYGTGLQYFYNKHRERFYDVGIAEAHAITFAAGLANSGNIPIFAVYSTFLQRGYDQILNDCALNNQHIVLCIDRAGIVGDDGPTHNGVFDVAFLSNIPNVTIYSPEGYDELTYAMDKAILHDKRISCVRYPKGKEQKTHNLGIDIKNDYSYVNNKSDTLLISYGRIFSNCYTALANITTDNKNIDMLKLLKIFPIGNNVLDICFKYKNIILIEEAIETGSVGQILSLLLLKNNYKGNFYYKGIDCGIINQGSVVEVLKILNLDAKSIKDFVIRCLNSKN